MSTNVYLSVQQAADAERYPFTIGQLRHYLTHRHSNGLNIAVRRVGKRIYLRQDLLEQWIEAQADKGSR